MEMHECARRRHMCRLMSLTVIPRGKDHYRHLIVEETEAQKGQVAFQFSQLESRSEPGQRSAPHPQLPASPHMAASWHQGSAGSITTVVTIVTTANKFSGDNTLMKLSPPI